MSRLKYQLLSMEDLGSETLYDLMRLRQEIFVVEQQCFYLDADGLDQDAYHFLGRDEKKKIIAYLRIIPPPSKGGFVRIGRVLVDVDYRGKGIAREIMTEAMKRIHAVYPGHAMKLSAQTHLTGFYASLEFIKVSEPYDEDGIEHVDMVREPGITTEKETATPQDGGCLSPTLMKNFAERSCTEEQRLRCVEHIRECKACYAGYLALMMSGLKEEERKRKGRVIYLMNHPVNLNALGLGLFIVAAGLTMMFLL